MRDNFLNRFREHLARHGKTLTPARETIVDVVLAMRCDFAAEDLLERLRLLNSGRVTRSTVFRTLEHLIQAGLLERFADGDAHYYRAVF